LTKDSEESFFELPESITIKSLEIVFFMDMRNKFLRIFNILRQLLVTRKKLQSYKYQYDCIYVTHVRNLLELYLSGMDMGKIIVTEHGSYYGYNIIYKILKKFLYPKCKYVVAPSSMDYEIYKSQKCNAFYIENPLSFYNDSMVSSLTSKTILNIGRLTGDKRQILLLEIWNKVSKKHPGWNLMIIGKGELKQGMIQYIEMNDLGRSVKIIDPIKNVESIFLQSSIFAFTSSYEGFGMVLAESMSYGVPCISFDVPSGPRDIIKNDIDGFLIENNDINQYIEKLELLINNDKLRSKMGILAKQNIKRLVDFKIEKKWNSLLDTGEV
jgi:glycosyltransferase involved in cell wall biosynthesis